MCDQMSYPLLFPHGDSGPDWKTSYVTTTREERKRMEVENEHQGDGDDKENGNLTARFVTDQADPVGPLAQADSFVEMMEDDKELQELEGDQDVQPNLIADRRRGKRKRVTQM